MIEKIEDHVQRALARLPQQFKSGLPYVPRATLGFSMSTIIVDFDAGAPVGDGRYGDPWVVEVSPVDLGGAYLNFLNLSPDYLDPDVTWFWDFGDGTTSTNVAPAVHEYPDYGAYTVTLTAYRGDDEIGTSTHYFIIVEIP